MAISDAASNIWGIVGIAFATVGGILVAIINSRSQAQKKENEKIKQLREELDHLNIKFNTLKTAFTLVFDEMERKGSLPDQLKDFKKIFEL